jgi:hypothetical protein
LNLILKAPTHGIVCDAREQVPEGEPCLIEPGFEFLKTIVVVFVDAALDRIAQGSE